ATRSPPSPTGASGTGCCFGSTTPIRRGTSRAGRRRFSRISPGLAWSGTRGPCGSQSAPTATARPRRSAAPTEPSGRRSFAAAVRGYLDELDLPRHDVHLDLARIRRLAIEAIAAMPDASLAERVGVDASLAPVLRGARDLVEAREYAAQVSAQPAPAAVDAA